MNKLVSINNSFDSFQRIINLYENYKSAFFEDIHIEIRSFFAANMSAALGAVLDEFISNLNDINFDYISPQIEQILSKNDFLSYFGREKAKDINRTTIKFQKLKTSDGKYFKNYVIEELIKGRISDLPKMSEGVIKKIVEAIYEIFVNAQYHSETEYIYTCGQFFPNKSEIEFTIVDTGIGFREKINRRFDSNLSSIQALKWAVEESKTTKEGLSGGLGLAVLREFVSMNKGKMQIISKDGFYQYDGESEQLKKFNGEFPGTIVNLQFKTNDSNNYLLSEEVDVNEIF